MATDLRDIPGISIETKTKSELIQRSAWRRKLVDIERGMTLGLRRDSTFFVHLFVGIVIVATAFVLGLDTLQWAIVVLSATIVLGAEMFNRVLQVIGQHAEQLSLDESFQQSLRIGTAAVFVTCTGALLTIGMVFVAEAWEIFGS